jgi:hypothetical protein
MPESAWSMPGRLARSVLGYELDSDKEWADKQRQEQLLKRLAAEHASPADRARLDPRIAAEIGSYERGELDNLKSPYHWRGLFTPGAPLYNSVAWFSSVPQVAVAGSQRLANWVDPEANPYPNAKKQFDSALNTATFYGAEGAGLVPKGTPTVVDVAEDAREMRGRRPAGYPPTAWDETVSHAAQKKASELQLSASDSLKASGVPAVPAMIAGTAMDSVLDPFNGLGAAVKAARAGVPALRHLVQEFALPQAMVAPAYASPVLSYLLPEPPAPSTSYTTKPGDYIRNY